MKPIRSKIFIGFTCLAAAILLGLLVAFPRTAKAQTPTPTPEICALPHQDVATPLTDLGNSVYMRMDGQNTGARGGLYPGGSNVRPQAHEAAGLRRAALIEPLNAQGAPDPENGKIVLISIGMSNTFMEFRQFERDAESDPEINPRLEIVTGAQAGRVSSYWVDLDSDAWVQVDARLAHSGVTPLQVQAAWIKLTQTGPGNFPEKAHSLENELAIIVRNLKIKYPNVKVAYLSSRTRSYTVWNGLSPEPAAYETGFAVKWLIERQINGEPELNFDPAQGPAPAPWLAWGPYLWADGQNPRLDGFTWLAQDMIRDCTHPSDAGVAKIAGMLMNFFKTDSTTGWFRGEAMARDYFYYIPLITY